MNNKPILIVLGEPYSIFSETLFKLYKNKIYKKLKKPIILIGSKKLLTEQMLKLKFKFIINEIKYKDINNCSINNKNINIINVNFSYKKIFDKISNKSKNYIKKCFNIALKLLKKKYAYALINGPISKRHFLNKKYLGITEYLTKKTNTKKSAMLIHNSNFSVCPITTHLPISRVSKSITGKKIIDNTLLINDFFIKKLNKKPKIAVLGLNPHCETINKFSEEDKIIKPALKYLLKKNINAKGLYSADTFFLKNNINKFDVAIGMYHDQVLIPIKTLYNFNAINITLGLPFLRISPDHGPNHEMIGKNKSDPQSIISAMNFFRKFDGK